MTKFSYELTYKQGRTCLFCGEPIADQDHKSKKFCERWVDEYDNVICHKDDYNTWLKKPINDITNKIIQYHKTVWRNIEKLLATKGENVTLDDLVANNINLYRSLEQDIQQDGKYIFYFLFYGIKRLNINSYQIFKHNLVYE